MTIPCQCCDRSCGTDDETTFNRAESNGEQVSQGYNTVNYNESWWDQYDLYVIIGIILAISIMISILIWCIISRRLKKNKAKIKQELKITNIIKDEISKIESTEGSSVMEIEVVSTNQSEPERTISSVVLY
mmetsp:Transcript_27804/g.24602  ORF Transcript_27804/g.24602 Transcript_27804/m.24602 type:complete len:131 (+) Transcript_27804:36-428(+)|eukprot:CAMPEP_0201572950 /NCGR_PEP_ID=MMETSP0190_2-20130828/16530_1 /ASSEMBLY_ACC=CAM_ASM_000263 /TAXON_ID=37353 /ORGANISM="Rosalina sp." /LENGTH=130 /DNA_ID=CAMNT_0047999343 /DNA_START=14 /DNA_END=406 /DNA_ORIENTATION=+